MKRIRIISLIAVFIMGAFYEVHAQVKNCPCGYGEAGCLPCEEEEKDIKPVQKKDSDEVKDCPCGYDAFSNCIPCKDVGRE